MENEEGKNVDLYIPRKCSYTNRLITAKDHASIQLNVAHVDANGAAIPGEYTPFVISGFVRNKGESDAAINLLAQKSGLLKGVIETHQQ